MSKHCRDLTVPSNSDLNEQDVYGVTGLTESVDATGGAVTLALNEDEVFKAYNDSCARADGTFEEFSAEVQQAANEGASQVYQEARALNDTWMELPRSVRIGWLRVCIRTRWIKIYINWHI